MANYLKTNEELLKELADLKLENQSLRAKYAQDITSHKRTEEVLKRSEHILNETQIITKVGGWEYDVLNNQAYYSDEVFHIYGIPNGRNFKPEAGIKYYHPEDRSLVFDSFQKAISDGEPYDLEVRFINARGENIWVKTLGKPVWENGKIVKVIGTLMDITYRKKAEEEREQFFRFFQNSADLMCLADPNGAFKKTNPAFIEILGYSESELISKPFIDFIIPEDKQRTIDEMARQIQNGYSTNFENRYLCKNGTVKWLSWRAVHVKEEGITYAIARDITESKQAELEIKTILRTTMDGYYLVDMEGQFLDTNDAYCKMIGYCREEILKMGVKDIEAIDTQGDIINRLHQLLKVGSARFETKHKSKDGRVIDVEASVTFLYFKEPKLCCFMRDITERKYAERVMLESERLSAIGEMSASIAHDFNNTLQVITGNVEMALLSEGNSQKKDEFLRAAKRSAGDAAARVQQLQRFTRKAVAIEHTVLDIEVLIDEVILQTRPIWKDDAGKKGIDISIQKNYGKINNIEGDPGGIRMVLHNLIKNAAEAMPFGGIIKLTTGIEGMEVYVRISDTGIGMDEKIRMRIFQPFFTTKGFEVGRGLGMSGAYSIMRDHGGKISVLDSIVGKGTTIELLFPVSKKKVPEVVDNITYAPLNISAKVLWVDDDEELREVEKEVMESLGFNVDLVASGKEALSLLEEKQYDLLITDIGMPGMNGWQLAEAIKGKYENMKLAIISGWGTDVSEEEKAKLGIDYIFEKPVTIAKLGKLVPELLKEKK
jgi:PAS domain S-box-containing protein